MSQDHKPSGNKTVWAALGLLLVPVLCCTAPLLVGAGAVGVLGVIGAAANNVWVSVVAALIAVGVVGGLLYRWWGRRKTSPGAGDCCPPSGAESSDDRSRHAGLSDSCRVHGRDGRR